MDVDPDGEEVGVLAQRHGGEEAPVRTAVDPDAAPVHLWERAQVLPRRLDVLVLRRPARPAVDDAMEVEAVPESQPEVHREDDVP